MALAVRTTEDLIRRSFVRHLREEPTLANAFPGGEHEEIAPRGTTGDFLTYRMVTAPYVDDFTKRTIRSAWDIECWSEDQVRAGTSDALVMNSLEENLVAIVVDLDEGPDEELATQTILYCRRIAGLRFKETTDEGKTIYRVGGTYEIWSDQPLRA